MLLSSPFEAHRRAVVVPLAGVVEDHVEDHLDVVLVQLADQHLELVDLLADLAEVAVVRLRREEGRGVVAPGVGQALTREGVAERAVELVELHHRHQLDRGDPQVQEVGDLVDEPPVGPAHVALGGVVAGEPPDVDLVDDRVLDRDLRVPVPLPLEVAPVGHAPRGPLDVVHLAGPEVAVGVGRRGVVVAQGVAGPPVVVAGDGRGVGVEQALRGVESGAVRRRVVGAVGPVVVERPVGQALDEDVPDVARPVRLGREGDHLRRPLVGHVVEQEELDPGRARRLEGEVDAIGEDRRPERVGRSGEDILDLRHG